jgi:hypothetical protein
VIAIAALFVWLQLPYVALSVVAIGLAAYLLIGVQKNLLLLRLSNAITQIAHDQNLVDVSKQPGGILGAASKAS